MRIFLELFILVQTTISVQAFCPLTVRDVEDETRVVAVKAWNSAYILNTDIIEPCQTLLFICNDINVVEVTCEKKGETFSFSQPLPIQNCAVPPQPVVEEIEDKGCSVKSYRVGYKYRGQFLEIYRTCLSKTKNNVLITSHEVYPYSLITKRPKATFTTDGIITLSDAANYQAKEVYNQFEKLLGPEQCYIRCETDQIIHRGHLTPSADFLFPNNMRATFKYANVIPQFGSINTGNWKAIEDYVRHLKLHAFIKTGAFGVLELRDKNQNIVQMYLQDGNRIPIPKWIYKVVSTVSGNVIFVVYNNIYDPVMPIPPCLPQQCPATFMPSNNYRAGFTFCCNPFDFAANVYPRVT